jgi:gas vesicle protein GvpN
MPCPYSKLATRNSKLKDEVMQRVVQEKEIATVLSLEPRDDFVETPYIRETMERAMAYLQAGFPIHFRGVAGTGKSTLAMHAASQLGRPVMLIHGDDEFSTSDLVGGEYGWRAKKVIDNFIHSVLKTEEEMHKSWTDNRVTIACERGFTLIYDEFTRSRPEANNVLLSILEEKMLNFPRGRGRYDDHLEVHPDFHAIFTSNPQEYAGVHKSQDALADRMITIDLDYQDYETEVAITCAKSGIPQPNAERIVGLVRDLRENPHYPSKPSVRAAVMIARVLANNNSIRGITDPLFPRICLDVLSPRRSEDGQSQNGRDRAKMLLEKAIGTYRLTSTTVPLQEEVFPNG